MVTLLIVERLVGKRHAQKNMKTRTIFCAAQQLGRRLIRRSVISSMVHDTLIDSSLL
jgi:hypothetical protein